MTQVSSRQHDAKTVESTEPALTAFLQLSEKIRARNRRRQATRETPDSGRQATESVLQSIEGEIIPRLMLVHRDAARADDGAPAVAARDRQQFLDSVLHDSASATLRLVDGLLERGVARETIFLDLLAEAARRLGELWEEDLCDFSDVTIGLCRLHEVLRAHSVVNDEGFATISGDAPRVLLSTVCADQHVFGVVMVAEFFRRAGWRVRSEPGVGPDRLADILEHEPFELLGLSVSCSPLIPETAPAIARMRRASCRQGLGVLVGGRAFVESPELVETTGADAAAFDGATAPVVGMGLIGRARSAT